MKKMYFMQSVAGVISTFFILSGPASANTDWNGGTGDWNTAGNWSNGTPGAVDNNAYFNNAGTINVTATPATVTPNTNFYQGRSSAGNTTLVWNPGAASSTVFRHFWVSDNGSTGQSVMDHQSGTIRASNSWYHIGRRGDGTYKMSGSSVVQVNDRLSIGEGAGGGLSNNFVFEMRDSSRVDGQFVGASNNDYYLGHQGNARPRLLMYDNAVYDVPRLEVARENTAQATIEQNGNSRIQVEFEVDRFAFTGDNKAWWTMNNNSTAVINNNLYMARNGNAEATLTLNGNASFQSGQLGASIELNRNTSTTIVMNNQSQMRVNSWMELGGGQATMTMNDQSTLDANGRLAVGMRSNTGAPGDGITRLTLNDQASVLHDNGNSVVVGFEANSNGLLTMNDASYMFASNLGVGRLGEGTLHMNSANARIDVQNWMVIGQESGGTTGAGTVDMDGGSIVVATSGGGDLHVGERTAATLNMNAGFIQVNNNMIMARDHRNINDATSDSIVNHNGGDIVVRGQLHMGGLSSQTHGSVEYNLDGGTLHVNNLHMGNTANILGTSSFNWGDGTLTVREVNENATGDGSVITVTGSLQTGYAGNLNASSTLDLGDLYKDGGTKFDTMNILANGADPGDLNLDSNADILDFWNDIQHLRPGGGAGVEITGEIQLISVAGTISGTFDNILGPGKDGTFFRTWDPAETTALGITGAGDLTRNRGAIIYKADGVYFAYNISGQIPEPATGMFLLFGTLMLRGVSVFRRNQRIRHMLVNVE